MRHLIPCLLVLLFTLAACAPPQVFVPLQPPATFTPVPDERGPAWAWDADPALRVVLAQDPSRGMGLAVEHGDDGLAVPADFGQGLVDLPVLLVWPRADGTDPLAADDRPGLHLLLAGSTEHGCPADDLELDLVPEWDAGGLRLDIALSGVPYLALPPDGELLVVDQDGRQVHAAADLASLGSSSEFLGFAGLAVADSSLGSVLLTVEAPVAWTQLQGQGDFIEVDFDHGCLATPPQLAAELRLTAWL